MESANKDKIDEEVRSVVKLSSLTKSKFQRFKNSLKGADKRKNRVGRAYSYYKAREYHNVSLDQKALSFTKKIDDFDKFFKQNPERSTVRVKTEIRRKNKIRNSNLVTKLLKGRFRNNADAKELILLSLTKNSAMSLQNIDFFSENRKIEVHS